MMLINLWLEFNPISRRKKCTGKKLMMMRKESKSTSPQKMFLIAIPLISKINPTSHLKSSRLVSNKARQSNSEMSQKKLLKKDLRLLNKVRELIKARKNPKKINLKKHKNHRKCLQEVKNSWQVNRKMILKKRLSRKQRLVGQNLLLVRNLLRNHLLKRTLQFKAEYRRQDNLRKWLQDNHKELHQNKLQLESQWEVNKSNKKLRSPKPRRITRLLIWKRQSSSHRR